jgi:hypothetical protein
MLVRRLALLVPILSVSCVSNENTAPPGDDAGNLGDTSIGPFPDVTSGETSVPDTSVPDTSVPDTSIPDAGADAPVDVVQPVTIVVTGELGPEQGITIVYQDATGAVLSTATTDSSGSASQAIPAGSQVTVLFGTPAFPRLYTITGVEPGDVLTATDPTIVTAQASIVAVPASPPDAGPDGGLNYLANAGACQTTFLTPPGALSLNTANCVSAGKFPLLVYAESPTFVPLAFAVQKGNALVTDGGVAQVSVGGAWSSAMTTQTVSVTNTPGGVGTGVLALTEVADRVGVPTTAPYPPATDAGVQSAAFTAHTGYADFVQSEANVSMAAGFNGTSNGWTYGAVATSVPAPSASGTTSFDLSQLLPLVTSVTEDATTVPGRPTLSWTSAASLASTAGVIASFTWNGPNDAGVTVSGSWTIVASSAATSVQAPSLPASASAWVPLGGAGVTTGNEVPVLMFIQATFLPGYPSLRGSAAAFPTSSIVWNGAIVPPLPAAGTVFITAYGPNPS